MASPAPAAEMNEMKMAEMAALESEMEMQWARPLESFMHDDPEMTIEEHQAEMKKIAATMPQCALDCVVSMMPDICGREYDINNTDYSCQCHAKEFSGAATKCTAKSCHINLIKMISKFLSSYS